MSGSGPDLHTASTCSATGCQIPRVCCCVWRWVINAGLSAHGPGEVNHAYPVACHWRRCRPRVWRGLSCHFSDLGRQSCEPSGEKRVMRGSIGDAPARRGRGRQLIGLVVPAVAAAAAVLPGGSGRAAASTAPPGVPELHWAACGNGFECATATVPLDYDHPGGPAISLALIRLPATDQRNRIGSLLTNPGGPGHSGVDSVRSTPGNAYPPGMPARFDIIGFDPRGVA